MASRRTAIAGTVLTLAVCAVATARAQMLERYYREKATPTQRDFKQLARIERPAQTSALSGQWQ